MTLSASGSGSGSTAGSDSSSSAGVSMGFSTSRSWKRWDIGCRWTGKVQNVEGKGEALPEHIPQAFQIRGGNPEE